MRTSAIGRMQAVAECPLWVESRHSCKRIKQRRVYTGLLRRDEAMRRIALVTSSTTTNPSSPRIVLMWNIWTKASHDDCASKPKLFGVSEIPKRGQRPFISEGHWINEP